MAKPRQDFERRTSMIKLAAHAEDIPLSDFQVYSPRVRDIALTTLADSGKTKNLVALMGGPALAARAAATKISAEQIEKLSDSQFDAWYFVDKMGGLRRMAENIDSLLQGKRPQARSTLKPQEVHCPAGTGAVSCGARP